MSLRTVLLLTFPATAVLGIASVYTLNRLVLRESFRTVEQQDAEKNRLRVRSAVDEQFRRIAALVTDYANWNDSYEVIGGTSLD